VSGVGEGTVADILTAAAKAERDLSFGSYPFGHGSVGEIGTNLVVRGRDQARLEAAVAGLLNALQTAGITAARV
jgi:molybdopterin-biosynthesis enzyme MoeA-like protein